MEITTQEFRELMQKGTYVEAGSEIFEVFHKYSQEALKITSEINGKYNPPEKIRELFSKLTESEIDEMVLELFFDSFAKGNITKEDLIALADKMGYEVDKAAIKEAEKERKKQKK